MPEAVVHTWVCWGILALGAVTFVALLFISAPYGRHERPGWGPTLPARLGWILMESPSVVVFALAWGTGDHALAPAPVALLLLWQLHYVHRTYVFPFRLRASGKRMPILVGLLAFAFTALNGYANGRQVGHFGDYPDAWLADPRFLAGATLFLTGLAINWHADTVLIHLRKPGETGYRIPRGGLYRLVSCPNYLGEMLEWIGWAVATWSLAGLAFAVYTVANLLPRALDHHRWYRERFPDYPPERRAVLPYVL